MVMNDYVDDLEKTGRGLFPYYLALLVIAPFPLGSNRPWAWSILAIAAFLLLSIYCIQYAKSRVRVPELTRTTKFAALCLVLWLAYHLVMVFPLPPQVIELVSPLGKILGYVPSVSSDSALYSISIDKTSTLIDFVKSSLYVTIFLLTILLVKSKDRLRNLLVAIVITGVLQAVIGLTVAMTSHDVVEEALKNVARGTFVNRNHFAGFLNLAIAASFGLLLAVGLREKRRIHRDRARHHWQSRMLDWRIYMVFYSGIMIFALIFSQSRGAWFAFVTMLVLGFVLLSTQKVKFKELLSHYKLPLFVLLIFIIAAGAETMMNRMTDVDDHWALRFDIWSNSFQIVKDFWVTGVGAGNFQYIYPLYDSGAMQKAVMHAHNDYLEILVEQGVIGFSLLGIVIFIAFKNAVLAIKHQNSLRKNSFAIASLMALSSLLVHAFVDFNFQVPSNAMYFFVFLGIASVQRGASIHIEARDIAWEESLFNSQDQETDTFSQHPTRNKHPIYSNKIRTVGK